MPESLKNKIFWFVFALLLILSVVFTYLRIYVWMDYQIVAQTSCDPQTEQTCFVSETEVATTTDSGIISTSTETTYYKLINKKAKTIFVCEQSTDKNGCGEELTCTEGEKSCTYEYCTEENVPEGESCYSKE